MSQEDYDEYKEGHQAGEEVAEELEEASTMEIAEGQLKRLLIVNPYAGKSETWWRGFKDGKVGDWDPPEVEDEEGESDEESE